MEFGIYKKDKGVGKVLLIASYISLPTSSSYRSPSFNILLSEKSGFVWALYELKMSTSETLKHGYT